MVISIEIRSHVAHADFELITVRKVILNFLASCAPPPKHWDYNNEGPGLWGDHLINLFM